MNQPYDFTIDGDRFRLTRETVIAALHGEHPEPVRTHAVDMEGRLFPVKQALAAALQIDRGRFISTRARDILRKLGFRIVSDADASAVKSPGDQDDAIEPAPEANDASPPLRLVALQEAIRLYSQRSDARPEDVISAAEHFERWLAGGSSDR